MTTAATSSEPMGPEGPAAEPWTLRSLFTRHKVIGFGALALVAVLAAFTAVGVLAADPVAVSASTTCTDWGSANWTQQHAYARRYLQEHGSLPGGASDPAAVVAAIDSGCTQAYANDAQDNATIAQAIKSN
jgi:hypothetical protein